MNQLPDELVQAIFSLEPLQRDRASYCRLQRRWQRLATLALHARIRVDIRDSPPHQATQIDLLLARCREDPELGIACRELEIHVEDDEGPNIVSRDRQ